jgi:alpha-tubulin suppressor-like RCC1 family protein
VWTFGCGDVGRLGHNDLKDRLVPKLLAAEVFEETKIVTVAAGGAHNTVGENSALWTWGAGYSGEYRQHTGGFPMRIPTVHDTNQKVCMIGH